MSRGVLAKGMPKEEGGDVEARRVPKTSCHFARTPGQVGDPQTTPSTAPQKVGGVP
jgi:hypothetical protein